MIHKAFERGGLANGQTPLEDHPVKTGEKPGDDAGKLADEQPYCLHGIRFLNECW